MSFKSVAGGFEIDPSDKALIAAQRAITKQVNERFVQVGAIFLKSSVKAPYEDKWYERGFKDTDLQEWIDNEQYANSGVGFNLMQGWMDIDIDVSDANGAPDPEFNRCILAAMDFIGIDTRFRFGRRAVGFPTHVLVQLGEDEAANFSLLTKFEPKAFTLNGFRYHCQLRSYPTNIAAANLYKEAKQTVMPGTLYTHKTKAGQYDLSVWYSRDGIAENVNKVAATTPRRVNFNEIVRAIAFGTALFVMRDQWVEGSRQVTANKFSGWLARVVKDSAAMNNNEATAKDVYCPIDDDTVAEKMIEFICREQGDDEINMRSRTYRDAMDKLNRNPDAKIPGWPSIEAMVGMEGVNALRAVFTPGSDVSELTKIAERYLYDETDDMYIDRIRHKAQSIYVHATDALQRRHKGDVIRISGKPKEAFRIYEGSDMRKKVDVRDMYPDLPPGTVFRVGDMGELVADDDAETIAVTAFNTWRGWPISPVNDSEYSAATMAKCVEFLDRLLDLLTRDNKQQAQWVKEWLAWTFQHPGKKQQIAWVCVGGQGVGKSFIGEVFVKALMGALWGSASPSIVENVFNIGPLKDKMFVFIDEAKFHSEEGTDTIKKFIRSTDIAGMEKFAEGRNYRIYARLMFASNKLDMNIGQSGVKDRALFYTRAYDKDHLQMTETEFRSWSETLKPFFDEFETMLKDRIVLEHYLKFFMELPVERHRLESIKLSSSSDADIVTANMGWHRRVLKHIIEDCRVLEDIDITYPFTTSQFNTRVTEVTKELGLRSVATQRVLGELQESGLIEKVANKGIFSWRFVWKAGTLQKKYGEFIEVPLDERYVFGEDDYGPNDGAVPDRPPPWRGITKTTFGTKF